MVKSGPDVRTQITRTLRRTWEVLLVVGIVFGMFWLLLPIFTAAKEPEPTTIHHDRMRSNYSEFVVGDLTSVVCRYTYVDMPLDIFTYSRTPEESVFRSSLRAHLADAGWKELPSIGQSLEFEREDLDYYRLKARVLRLPAGSVVVAVRVDRNTRTFQEQFQRNWVRVVAAEGGSRFSDVK